MARVAEMKRLFDRMVNLERSGRGPSTLRELRDALRILGNPHLLLPTVVNVVGTKGKGSTAFHLAALLQEMGHTVGLFTSPHLRGYHERVRINQAPIHPDVLASYVLDLHRFLSGKGGFRSVFELLTLAAIQIFLDAGVDVAIFEAGLGGRLDATAVFRQDLTLLTPIGYDHADILGHHLPHILREKLGILKHRQGELITARQRPFLQPLVRQMARFYGVPLYEIGHDLVVVKHTVSLEGTKVEVRGMLEGTYHTSLIGDHQVQNFVLALLGAYILTGHPPPRQVTPLQEGRFQVLPMDGRWVVLDGAHNAMSLEFLRHTLFRFFPPPWSCVLGFQRDKLIAPVRRELSRWPARFWATSPGPPRGIPPEALRQSLPLPWEGHGPLKEAFREALGKTPPGGVVVVTGSLYLVGQLLPESAIQPVIL